MDCSLTVMRYLDRVQGLYPYGIPQSVLDSFHSQPHQTLIRKGLIFVVSVQENLTPELIELLDSIVTKGLLLVPEQISIVTAHPEDLTEDRVRGCIEELNNSGAEVPFAILFGAGLDTPGMCRTVLTTPTLSTRSLSEVLVSREVKREVWQHLQQIKPLTEFFNHNKQG